MENVKNGLNNCALAALFDLFNLTHSPSFVIMKKMEKYSDFKDFIADAARSRDVDFTPELCPEESFDEKVDEEEDLQ